MSVGSAGNGSSGRTTDTEDFWNQKKESLESIKQNIRNGKRNLLARRFTPAPARQPSRQQQQQQQPPHPPGSRQSQIPEPQEAVSDSYRNYLRRRFPHIANATGQQLDTPSTAPPASQPEAQQRRRSQEQVQNTEQGPDPEVLEAYIYFCDNRTFATDFVTHFIEQQLDDDEIPDILIESVSEISGQTQQQKQQQKRKVRWSKSAAAEAEEDAESETDPLAPQPDDSAAVTDILSRFAAGSQRQRRPKLQPLARTPRSPLTSPSVSRLGHAPQEAASVDAMQVLLRDQLPQLLHEIAAEAVGEEADKFVTEMDLADIVAPFLLNSSIEELLREICADAIKELAMQEVAKGFHYDIFLELVDELLLEVGPAIARRAVGEDFVESLLDDLVEPVVDEMALEVAADLLQVYDQRLRHRDLKEIRRTAKEKPLDSLIFQHLVEAAASGDSQMITSRQLHNFLDATQMDILLKQRQQVSRARRLTLECEPLRKLHLDLFTEAASEALMEELINHSRSDLADIDFEEVQDHEQKRYLTLAEIDEIYKPPNEDDG